jgi:methyltransferase of ATP-grasp peptide maturase system
VNTIEQLRQAMVAQLIEAGRLHSQPWIEAFRRVPRNVFLRRFFRQSQDLSGWEAVSELDSDALEMIYTDTTWVTQLDNDPDRWEAAHAAGRPVHGLPTSSSTAPGLMALMLEALDVHDGHQVLEIGTGTGYNAALLCHRLGSTQVSTIEVDPAVAEDARSSLYASGYLPTVAIADGAAGHPAGAPYDRLIATCSVPAVPAAWITHLRSGGLILTSLHRDLGGGPLVLLSVANKNRAEGRFLPEYGGFMPLRSAASTDAQQRLDAALGDENQDADIRPATIGPGDLDDPAFGMVAALRLPGVASIGFQPATGPQLWLIGDDGSWACRDEATGTVSQHGDRRLWDELEDTHRRWMQLGKPSRERFGLTVTASGDHTFWLDEPQSAWWTEPACPPVAP